MGSGSSSEANETDFEAQRILALAIALLNSNRPLATSYFYANFYPGKELEAQRKAFKRDREKLARCGLVLNRSESPTGEALWSADKSSLAQPNALTATEALTIDVACLPFASDPSFPYAADLRMALSKIDRSFSEVTAAKLPPSSRTRSKQQATVERCLSALYCLRITYDKASGERVERTVAVYGLFTLRSTSYMVAARINADGKPGPAHSYSISRIVSAKEIPSLTYEIPEDFDVRDFIRLPFQIGSEQFVARFLVPSERLADLKVVVGARGTFESYRGSLPQKSIDDDGENDTCITNSSGSNTYVIWSVEACDTKAAASWAIAEGIVPIEPKSLVSEWKSSLVVYLEGASSDAR